MKRHKLHDNIDNSLSSKPKSFQMLFEREQKHGLIIKLWRQTVLSRGTGDNEPFVPESFSFEMEPQVDQQLQIAVETDLGEMTRMCSASTDIQKQICECIWRSAHTVCI